MTSKRIPVAQRILGANDRLAEENRSRLEGCGVYSLNIMASPGAGKTSTILRTLEALSPQLRIGVVEGDTAAVTIDTDRVMSAGAAAVQINTGGSCHLDAVMVGSALSRLPLDELDLLIVENVGNLICPAAFRLGTHSSVVIASVPEGDDKPYKYPKIYLGADALILNKTDLLPHQEFNLEYFRRGVEILNSRISFFPLSCKTGEGFGEWTGWVVERLTTFRRQLQKGGTE